MGNKVNKEWYFKPITIGINKINVKYLEDLDCFGTYSSYPEPTICLGPQSPNVVAYTLFHECIHAISDFYELGLTEHQVRVLEQTIPDLLKNNPSLTSNIIKQHK